MFFFFLFLIDYRHICLVLYDQQSKTQRYPICKNRERAAKPLIRETETRAWLIEIFGVWFPVDRLFD